MQRMVHVEKKSEDVGTEFPTVSIVIPVLNKRAWIEQTIGSLLAQTYPTGRFEILVVDNGSIDGTQEIIRQLDVQVLHEPIRSSYRARNRGIEASDSEYIAFIDADCTAEQNWLKNLMTATIAEESDIVAGRIENMIMINNLANRLLALRCSPEKRNNYVKNHHSVAAGNMLVSRSLFVKYGFFNATISGSDGEFSRRLARAGRKITYAGDAVVTHQCDLTNLQYLMRTFRIAYGQEANREGGNVIEYIIRIPWRPGFGAARQMAVNLSLEGTMSLTGLWAYMWTARVFDYLGRCAGAFVASINRWRTTI